MRHGLIGGRLRVRAPVGTPTADALECKARLLIKESELRKVSETTGVYRARITSKGQVTIPAAVRRATGLKPGDDIGFEPKTGRFTPLPRRPLMDLYGALPPHTPMRPFDRERERAEMAAEVARHHAPKGTRVKATK